MYTQHNKTVPFGFNMENKGINLSQWQTYVFYFILFYFNFPRICLKIKKKKKERKKKDIDQL
jgi:hypothetical protein